MSDSTQKNEATLTYNPLLGIGAVLMGAALATFLARLLSVGAGDLRGAPGAGFRCSVLDRNDLQHEHDVCGTVFCFSWGNIRATPRPARLCRSFHSAVYRCPFCEQLPLAARNFSSGRIDCRHILSTHPLLHPPQYSQAIYALWDRRLRRRYSRDDPRCPFLGGLADPGFVLAMDLLDGCGPHADHDPADPFRYTTDAIADAEARRTSTKLAWIPLCQQWGGSVVRGNGSGVSAWTGGALPPLSRWWSLGYFSSSAPSFATSRNPIR